MAIIPILFILAGDTVVDVCYICGNVISTDFEKPSGMLTRDHIVPRALGGSNGTDNLLNCCRRCNSLKAANPPIPLTFLCIRLVVSLSVTPTHLNVYEDSATIGTDSGSITISKENITVSGDLAESEVISCLFGAFKRTREFYDPRFTVVAGRDWLCSSVHLDKSVLCHPASVFISRLLAKGYMFEIVKVSSIQDIYSIAFSAKSRIIITCNSLQKIEVQDCSRLRTGPFSPSMEFLDDIIMEANSMNLDLGGRLRNAAKDLLTPLYDPPKSASCLLCGCTVDVPSSEEYSVLCPLCAKLVGSGIPITGKSRDLVKQLYELRISG